MSCLRFKMIIQPPAASFPVLLEPKLLMGAFGWLNPPIPYSKHKQ